MSDKTIKENFNENSKIFEKKKYKISFSENKKLEEIEHAYNERLENIITGQIKPCAERVEQIKQEILRSQGRPQPSMEHGNTRPRFNPDSLNSLAERRAVHEIINELNIQRDKDIQAITGQQPEGSQEKSMANIFNGNSFNATEYSRRMTRSDEGREDDGRER